MRGILGCEKKRTHIPIPECVDSFVEGAKEFQEKEEHPRRCFPPPFELSALPQTGSSF